MPSAMLDLANRLPDTTHQLRSSVFTCWVRWQSCGPHVVSVLLTNRKSAALGAVLAT